MSVDFSWYLDEEVSPTPEDAPRPKEPAPRGWMRRVFTLLVLVLLATAALGYGYYYRQQQRLIAEFQRVLDREVAFWQSGRYDTTQLRLIVDTERWRDSKGNYPILGFFGVAFFPNPKSLPPLTVKKVELHDDMAWVWVEWEDEGGRYARVHFYRRVEGLWKRTIPDERFPGRRETLVGPIFRWTFYERDAPYVRPLAAWAEETGQSISADFGLSQPPRLKIRFVYQESEAPTQRAEEILYPSPLISRVRLDGKPNKLLRSMVVWGYVNRVVDLVAPSMPRSPTSPYPSTYYGFRSAVLQWEMARYATPLWKEVPIFSSLDVDNPPSIDDVFGFQFRPPDGDPFPYAVSLVFFIGERYGPDKVVVLLRQLQDTPSFTRALATTLGPDFAPDTFEREWHGYLRQHAAMFQPGGKSP